MKLITRRLHLAVSTVAALAVAGGGSADLLADAVRLEGTVSVTMRDLVLLSDGTAEVTLVNRAEGKTLVAWKVDFERDGFRSSSFVGGDSLSVADLYPHWGPPSDGLRGVPGAAMTVQAPWPLQDDLAGGRDVALVLDVVLFDDFSFEGDADEARRLFARRGEELAQRERWMPRIRELVRTTHTAETAIPRLEALSAEIDEAEGTPEFGRGDLQQEIHDTLRHLRESPEHAVPILEEYLRFAEASTEVARRETPPGFRPPSAGLRR